MNGRFWFYSAFGIIVLGLAVWNSAVRSRVELQVSSIERAGLEQRVSQMKEYSAKQNNARKLVSLAKNLKNEDPAVLRPLIERAYKLNPNSRDITLLASYYRPELKERAKKLDPLWDGQ